MGSGSKFPVMVVLHAVVTLGQVALGAHAVARRAQLHAVLLVTITAHDAGLMHLALDKGTVHVDLVANLAVRVVQRPVRYR